MPKIIIPSQLREVTGGEANVSAQGSTVLELIENLDEQYPGIRDRLIEDGKLRMGLAAAVDNEVSSYGLKQKVSEGSTVQFIPAISGG